MKELYIKIIEILTDAATVADFESNGVKPVRYVDIYKGQFQDPENFDSPLLPAVWFEWSILTDSSDDKKQDFVAAISLYCEYEQVADSSSISQNREQALKYFDFLNLIQKAISESETSCLGRLKFNGMSQVQMNRPGVVHVINYEAIFNGYTTDIADEFDYSEENEVDLELEGNLITNINEETNPYSGAL